jgi:hypothetical protein
VGPQNPARSSAGRRTFIKKLQRKCFNCFATDHQVAECKDPPRCWKCKKYGHISLHCRRHVPSSPLKKAVQSFNISPSPARPEPIFYANHHLASSAIRSSKGKLAIPYLELEEVMDHHWCPAFDISLGGRVAEAGGGYRGNAVNYPGNPCFCLWVAFKMVTTSDVMGDREKMLSSHTLVVKEKGLLSIRFVEERKETACHHFNFRKHELYAYHTNPHPFVIIFAEKHA